MLARDKHVAYFKRCLGILPTAFESEDSNTLAIAYFSLAGLGLLEAIEGLDRNQYIDWIYTHLVETDQWCGFRGSSLYEGTQLYDPPNIGATLFAIQSLLMLGDSLEKINRSKVMSYLVACQREDGSFAPTVDLETKLPFGEEDSRYCMIAASIRRLIGPQKDDINLDSLQRYVESTVGFDGGLSMGKLCESHAGLTYCGIDALSLIGRLQGDWQSTVDFLVHRQVYYTKQELESNEDADVDDIGGFNGRINKYADTCYAFWSISTLTLLGAQEYIDAEAVAKFLLEGTQNALMGGFNKCVDEDGYPDPLHSFLGLATLSLLGKESLAKLDVETVIVL